MGASFIEGAESITITEYLRNHLQPLGVYSLAMGGQGIQHWGLQFNRYMNSSFIKNPPKIVVLNFYGGNTVNATFQYKSAPVPAHILDTSEKELLPQKKFSLYGELISMVRAEIFNKLFTAPMDAESSSQELAKVFDVFSEVVNGIREKSPGTNILLSYIPSPGGVYGLNVEHCLSVGEKMFHLYNNYSDSCHESAARQAANSEMLKGWASELNIHYLDVVPVLQRHSNEILHLYNNPHFNEEGNRIYSEELANKIKELIL